MTLVFEPFGDTRAHKSSASTDIVDGEFLELVPNELVRQCFTFRSNDPSFAGVMVMTWTLASSTDATHVAIEAENVPAGISPHDHQLGMQSSLANLARFVE
jgi:uncharacterized protein YndB with AHSA1/START domain